MVAQHWEGSKRHQIGHIKTVSFMSGGFHLHQTINYRTLNASNLQSGPTVRLLTVRLSVWKHIVGTWERFVVSIHRLSCGLFLSSAESGPQNSVIRPPELVRNAGPWFQSPPTEPLHETHLCLFFLRIFFFFSWCGPFLLSSRNLLHILFLFYGVSGARVVCPWGL